MKYRVKMFFETEDIDNIIISLLRSRRVLVDMQGKPVVECWAYLVYDPWSEKFLVLSHSPSDKDKNYIYLYSLAPIHDVNFEDVYSDLVQVVEDYPNITMV